MICLRFRHSLHHCVIAVKMCQRVGGLEPCQTQNVSRFIFWMTSEKLYAKFGVQTEKNWWLCSAKISSAENITMMQLWAISPAEGRGNKGSSHGISKISERDLFLPLSTHYSKAYRALSQFHSLLITRQITDNSMVKFDRKCEICCRQL